jgi:RNA methyltransferase, TrmH family
VITSRDNPKLRTIARLNARRDRDLFVAEGEDLLDAALAAGWQPQFVLRAGIDVEPRLLDDVSALGSGTRVAAVFDRRPSAALAPLCVALWGVKDPGNVGTVLRSALAFGAGSVALGPETADPFAPKAVRASMGAAFAVPVGRAQAVSDLPGPVLALDASGDVDLRDAPVPGSVVVGAERTGLPAGVLAAADVVARIPIGAAESLNAAMAATIALYDLAGRVARA